MVPGTSTASTTGNTVYYSYGTTNDDRTSGATTSFQVIYGGWASPTATWAYYEPPEPPKLHPAVAASRLMWNIPTRTRPRGRDHMPRARGFCPAPRRPCYRGKR